MRFHTTHHIYKFALRKKVFENIFFLEKSPVQPLTRVCDTVFFKHKYLTMPTITSADALIKAADNLVDAISGVIPKNSITEDTVLQLMTIYRKQAIEASDAESAQRVLRCLAETQRVQTEQEIAINEQNTNK